jgi:hypothetical protein
MRPGGPPVRPISGNAIARILRDRAGAAGLPTTWITGHSLRAGHATSAALAGIGVERIAAQTRHKRIDVLIERYIRPIEGPAHHVQPRPRTVTPEPLRPTATTVRRGYLRNKRKGLRLLRRKERGR